MVDLPARVAGNHLVPVYEDHQCQRYSSGGQVVASCHIGHLQKTGVHLHVPSAHDHHRHRRLVVLLHQLDVAIPFGVLLRQPGKRSQKVDHPTTTDSILPLRGLVPVLRGP